jgi:integrase
MPGRKREPHLWLRKERRRPGRAPEPATWIIIDDRQHVATGCLAGETGKAQAALDAYMKGKYSPERSLRDIEHIPLADVLSIFFDDCRDRQANHAKFDERIARLNGWWGNKMLSEVNGPSCREYAAYRGNSGGSRRDLEDLRAAINHHAHEGHHRGLVKVVLPPKGEARQRWLTREEAAKVLWVCWRYREVQTVHRGALKGQKVQTDKRPLRHLARFLLLGLYTGTRAGAIATASPYRAEGRSFVDLDRGIYYRLAQGRRATNKRQPPVPIPDRLLAHMRRWVRKGIALNHFVEWRGKPVASVKTAMASAVRLAKLSLDEGNITPHTLRHTAATWLMQTGTPIWEAAGFLGMSEKVLREVYGHHHPDHLRGAADAITLRPARPAKLWKTA